MNDLFRWIGHVGFVAGVVLGAIAVGVRFSGGAEAFGFLRATLLNAGTFTLALGCAGYLASLVQGKQG